MIVLYLLSDESTPELLSHDWIIYDCITVISDTHKGQPVIHQTTVQPTILQKYNNNIRHQ